MKSTSGASPVETIIGLSKVRLMLICVELVEVTVHELRFLSISYVSPLSNKISSNLSELFSLIRLAKFSGNFI